MFVSEKGELMREIRCVGEKMGDRGFSSALLAGKDPTAEFVLQY